MYLYLQILIKVQHLMMLQHRIPLSIKKNPISPSIIIVSTNSVYSLITDVKLSIQFLIVVYSQSSQK